MTTVPTSMTIDCDGTRIAAEVRGSGPAVLLLHGYPETKAMWSAVAADLARDHTVVAADLRGYGDSDKPRGASYAKRDMADDQVILMRELGHERFAVVGHDRGGRVGHRLALDHPDAVSALAVLDIVPTLHMFENVDRQMATAYFHWFFLARGDGMPEALISADRETWLRSRFVGRRHDGDALPDAYGEYLRCFDVDTVYASGADYRAAAGIDLEHDRADRAEGRVLDLPVLALWGAHSYVGRTFDVRAAWATYAPGVAGAAIDADHYLAEEAPRATASALRAFLTGEVAA
ncbi:Haloacetate dehalogenase H-1 [Microbacterium oxydans]|uniref:Haloacetate dehalogenase H-1 n=1 Tax=Microbacterium oxydans TaxID=82380 RepID=A0A0F0KYU6_9MICO|nr:alpha/beta hydrolase [Microbacterium oxydans]KJL24451.1 Haloacetate dehalogenase H-1 [Microbacterium oxydans]